MSFLPRILMPPFGMFFRNDAADLYADEFFDEVAVRFE